MVEKQENNGGNNIASASSDLYYRMDCLWDQFPEVQMINQIIV